MAMKLTRRKLLVASAGVATLMIPGCRSEEPTTPTGNLMAPPPPQTSGNLMPPPQEPVEPQQPVEPPPPPPGPPLRTRR